MQQRFRLLRRSRLLVSLVILTMAIGLLSPAQGLKTAAAAAGVTLSGTVTNEQSAPVSGATVSVLTQGTSTVVGSATTDAAGAYSITVPADTYDIQLIPPAGTNYSQQILQGVSLQQNTVLPLTLAANTALAQVTGKVTNPLGQAQPGVKVRIMGPNVDLTYVTDQNGMYSATQAAGAYQFNLVSQDNDPALNVPTNWEYTVNPINLTGGPQTVSFQLPLKRVDLTVVDTAGQPVPGATIFMPSPLGLALPNPPEYPTAAAVGGLYYGADSSLTHHAVTDATGHVTLWLYPTTYQYSLQARPAAGSGLVEGGIRLAVSADTQATIVLQRPIIVSGQVTNALGEGIPNQRISLINDYAGGTYTAMSDASGNYSIQVPPATYRLRAEAYRQDVNIHAPSVYTFDLSEYKVEQSMTINLPLPIHKIDLHAQDWNGNPLSSVALQTFFWGPSIPNTTYPRETYGASRYASGYDYYDSSSGLKTDANGNATMWLLSYENGAPYMIGTQTYTAVGGSVQTQATADAAYTITAGQPVTVTGTIRNPLGEPIPGLSVWLWGPGGSRLPVTTDSQGRYSQQTSPGRYGLQIMANRVSGASPSNLYLELADYDLSSARTLDITLPMNRVKVHVQDASGYPVAGVALSTNSPGVAMNTADVGAALFARSSSSKYYPPDLPAVTDSNGDAYMWFFPSTQASYQLTADPGPNVPIMKFTRTGITGSEPLIAMFLEFSHPVPVTTMTKDRQPGADGTYSGPVTVTLAATAASGYTLAGTYYQIDSSPVQTYAGPFTVSGGGQHTVRYWSKDNTGVTERAHSAAINIATVDTTPPVVTYTLTPTPNAAGWNKGDVTATWNVTDPESSITAGCDPVTVTAETAGTALTCRATNSAGLTNDPVSVTVRLDKTAPVTRATVDGGNVTLAAADNLSGVKATHYTVDGGAEQTGTSLTVTAPGAHVVAFWSEDAAGNVETRQSVTVTIPNPTLDTTPPVTTGTLVTDPVEPVNGWVRQAVITLNATDDLSGVKATYVTGNHGTLTYQQPNLTIDQTGIYDLAYWSVDNAGNAEEHHPLDSIQVDHDGPYVSATGYLNAEGRIVVFLSGEDNQSGLDRLEWSLDKTNWHLYTGPFFLPDGFQGKLYFRGFDKLGNETDCEADVLVITGEGGDYRICGTGVPGATMTFDVYDPETGKTITVTVTVGADGTWCTVVNVGHECTCRIGGGGMPIIIVTQPPNCGGTVSKPVCLDCGAYGGGEPIEITVNPTGGGGSGITSVRINTGGGGGGWIDLPPGGGTYTIPPGTLGGGGHDIIIETTDGAGNTGTQTIHVNIDTDPPAVGVTYDPGTDTVNVGVTDTGSGVEPGDWWTEIFDVHCGCRIIIVKACDHVHNCVNKEYPRPTFPTIADQWSYEGETKAFDLGAFGDVDADGPWTIYVNWGDGTPVEVFTSSTLTIGLRNHRYLDNRETPYQVRVQAINSLGLGGVGTFNVRVLNLPPDITKVTGPTDPLLLGTPVQLVADFTDPGILDWHTATFEWGDGTSSQGAVTESPGPDSTGTGSTTGTHTYAGPGVYTVKITVTDKDGASDVEYYQFYIVIYDPDGGFVTGGGWINSPAGAYAADPSLSGRANFGFVSKYLKGANVPTGQTEFQFKVGNLNFHSTSYDWLVVAGGKAQYKGSGTINGQGDYGFMLTAIDGQLTGGVDTFRIKIWDKATGQVIYDNQLGASDTADPTTALAGGSIVIHKEN